MFTLRQHRLFDYPSFYNVADNGTVCTVKQDGRPYGVQMVALTEKLTNLKYELLMACLDRDIQFFSYA
jgi:hypothetical protein